MVSTKEHKGLCSTCNHSNDCSQADNGGNPVQHCEEFDGYSAEPVRAKGRVNVEGKNDGKYNGLCTNCGIRETCTYPKPEGGVWHCEEYK